MKKLLITIGLALVAGVTAHAGGQYFYGRTGQYLGNAQSSGNGYYFYGNQGQYLGSTQGHYLYGGNGQYLGSIQGDQD
jgi:hypothetical protein